ncbi:DUF6913 domain-containing protein [Flavobacterium johnsoniae]|jgi:hypothetical protein|uniref:Uncharacterized protein n=1 Tax=Flavobacterium johnsoniae (strain ATCC 17061 / DSM 2064 / JCM 8514 / BCRC 14874 / CCUG 350202 / NBRC 14942 / NCIMB 11054 / UW101) TaxID=376686 RepID=A5FE83_FLAJ1|nr:hypothetical protein Fjoh_3471 [Flavobacterium johnsoniae UW101]OXE95204.1 hypothetical protein B0A63_25255 [Flavobacterium johnsoniae UW101]SHK77072.1 hypothetical protein SAMN05444146_2219 [Flavobacterium johnsoniae]
MFLNYIKEFFVKKSLKNNLNIVKNEVFTSNIQTVGLLVDETQFRYSKELIKELVLNGIAEENIKIVAYRRKFKKKKIYSKPTFGRKHIDWRGQVTEAFLSEFIDTEFDLLISYYEVETPILMMLTSKSKAKFKVGFSSVDKKLNRWMIETTTAEYKLFISELFRYLKSLK